MSYKKSKTSYYDYTSSSNYKGYKGYYYYSQQFFQGDTIYDEVYKATCKNSIENTRQVYKAPYLTIKYDKSTDTSSTDLSLDTITISEKQIKGIEERLKQYCRANDISFSKKRAIIDIFKFVYIHELSHIKYTKRLMQGKDLLESIKEFDKDKINDLLLDKDIKIIKFNDYEILCTHIVQAVIFQIMNILEDIFINQYILKQEYKNQFFDGIVDTINIINRNSEQYLFKYVDYCLDELKNIGVSDINELTNQIPTHHDYIMFVYDVLVKYEFKIKTKPNELEKILIYMIKKLFSKEYSQQKYKKKQQQMKEQTLLNGIDILREKQQTDISIMQLRNAIRDNYESIVKKHDYHIYKEKVVNNEQ